MKKFLLSLLLVASSAWSAELVEIVIPFAAGAGAADMYGRNVHKYLSDRVPSKEFIVVNKGGADGRIALQYVQQRAPEVTTVIILPMSVLTMNQVLNETPGFKVEDFAIYGPVYKNSYSLAVNPKSGIKDFDSFIKLARTRPVNCGAGNLASIFFAKVLFNKLNIHDAQVITFKNSGEASLNTMNGSLDCVIDGLGVQSMFHKDNKLKILAVTDKSSIRDFNDLNNIKLFSSVIPHYHLFGWYAYGIPKSIPESKREEIFAELRNAHKSHAFADIAESLRFEIMQPPANPMKFLDSQYNLYNQLRMDIGIQRNQ